MNIAYLSSFPDLTIANWSGLELNIYNCLKSAGFDPSFYGTNIQNIFLPKTFGILNKVLWSSIGKRYLTDRTIYLAKTYAKNTTSNLSKNTNIIFSPSTIQLAYLDSSKPKVFYTDATFAGMIDYYKEFSKLSPLSIKAGHQIEQAAIDKSDLMIFSSDWAALSAIRHYKANPEKIRVIPFGSNIQETRTVLDIEDIISNKDCNECHLFFLGVDWYRKGGDIALDVTKRLNSMGLRTTLHIAGIKKLNIPNLPDFVLDHGFLNKSIASDRGKLESLFSSSHFLILPSKADCTPVVFSEANSFGLPCISFDTGGISSIIKQDVNGSLFNPSVDPSEIAIYIFNCFSKYNDYKQLAKKSFQRYESALNWRVVSAELETAIKNLV